MNKKASTSPFDNLVYALSRLPGLGRRSANRIALYLLTRKESAFAPLIKSCQTAYDQIVQCSVCGNLDHVDPCHICTSSKRAEAKTLCVVATVSDLWAVERSRAHFGHYHVLGGVLSALDGITPEKLAIGSLLDRIKDDAYQEIIIALGATVNGQTTSYYIHDRLKNKTQAKISGLAHGVPVGGELDYLDEGTISTALRSRSAL
jgi:recombination protein RecR